MTHRSDSENSDAPEQVGRRIGRNSVYMVVRTVLIMFVSLYTSRLALELLGETDYGIYSLVAGFVIMFNFLNISMERSITRFLMYEKSKGTSESLQKMFNVSMMAQFCIVGLVMLIGETVGLWWVNNGLNVPTDKMTSTNWVYQLSLITLCFNIVKVPYNAMIVAFEKMSFYALFSMAEVLLRLGCILALLLLKDHLLIIYSAQFMAVTMVVVGVYKCYCCHARVFGNVCRFHWYWNGSWFRQILSFCGWSTLGTAAFSGSFQGASLILNHFFGVVVNAAFGLAAMVQQAFFSILASFQTAFSPKLIALYAQDRLDQLRPFICKLGKYSFFLACMLIVPACVNIEVALHLWLGKEIPANTSIFCILSIVINGIDCIAAPAIVCIQATGKVRSFNIGWSIIMLLNLPLAYIFLYFTEMAPLAFVVRLVLSFVSYIFFAIMMQRRVSLGALGYIMSSLLRPMWLLAIPLAATIFLKRIMVSSILSAIANIFLFWILFGTFVLFFGLDAKERMTLMPKLRKLNYRTT